MSVQQPANQSAEMATETRNAFIRSRMGKRLTGEERSPTAEHTICLELSMFSAFFPLCPVRSKTQPMNSIEGDPRERHTIDQQRVTGAVHRTGAEMSFCQGRLRGPMLPNSTQQSQSMFARADSDPRKNQSIICVSETVYQQRTRRVCR